MMSTRRTFALALISAVAVALASDASVVHAKGKHPGGGGAEGAAASKPTAGGGKQSMSPKAKSSGATVQTPINIMANGQSPQQRKGSGAKHSGSDRHAQAGDKQQMSQNKQQVAQAHKELQKNMQSIRGMQQGKSASKSGGPSSIGGNKPSKVAMESKSNQLNIQDKRGNSQRNKSNVK